MQGYFEVTSQTLSTPTVSLGGRQRGDRRSSNLQWAGGVNAFQFIAVQLPLGFVVLAIFKEDVGSIFFWLTDKRRT
jgi:hypothetical protein